MTYNAIVHFDVNGSPLLLREGNAADGGCGLGLDGLQQQPAGFNDIHHVPYVTVQGQAGHQGQV